MERAIRARVLLAEAHKLGLTLDDLTSAADGILASVRPVPTVSEYLASLIPTFSKGTRRTYGTYWRLAATHFGDRRLDDVGVEDCETVLAAATLRAQRERPGSDGRAPRENCVAALRALFRRAERAKLIPFNPAMALEKPRRVGNRRRSLSEIELSEVVDAVYATSADLALDLLLVEFHLESGARQQGARGLVLDDMDERRSTVWLLEKFGKVREQPISPSLFAKLIAHAKARGAERGSDKVLRTKRNKPISPRRYDTLFGNVQRTLPWTNKTPVTAHVLRHTTGAEIERIAGEAVAEAFLGHTPASVTGIYTKGRIGEIAAALAVISGEAHPLAEPRRAASYALARRAASDAH